MSRSIEEQLVGFDQYIARCARAWAFVPGIALAIVKGNRCVYTHCYGMRDVERKLPVTEETLFEIGSITKSFTATALGMLVDEGQLAWDTPICEYLPAFALSDAAVTAQVTLRDLLTHRTGLPRHDYVHIGATASREELVACLRHLTLSAPLRTKFQYCNLHYKAAGWMLEQLAGVTWEEFIRRRIFTPLKMRVSTFFTGLTGQEADLALGYERKGQTMRPSVLSRNILSCAGSAGSISSTIADMCRWLSFQMNHGKSGRRELLKEATLQALHAPVMVIPSGPDAEIINPTYGMGWLQMAYRGHLLIAHGGATCGFLAHLSFLPREKIGVVVLTNGESNMLLDVLAYHAYDRLLELPPAPWYHRKRRLSRLNIAKRQEKEQQESTIPAQPTTELRAYAGAYHHPGYGHLLVRPTDETIEIDFHGITFRLYQKDDRYEIAWHGRIPLTLARDDAGAPMLAISFEPSTAAIVFTKENQP